MAQMMRKIWRHLVVWGVVLAYLLAAPGLYDRFIAAEGKPVSVTRDDPPAADPWIQSDVYYLVALNDQGLFQLRGWAFRTDAESLNSRQDQKQVVLVKSQEMLFFETESERSFDIDVMFADLGIDLTRAGFSARIYKDALTLGMYRVGIFLTGTEDGDTSFAFLKACVLKTPNRLLLKTYADVDCRSMEADLGKPVGTDVPLPDETMEAKMWLEQMKSNVSEELYQLEGWAFLTVDRTRAVGAYRRQLVLIGPHGNLLYDGESVQRPDVDAYFESEGMNLLLSGFRATIDSREIDPGVYGIGLIFTDVLTRESYYADARRCMIRTDRALTLAENGSPECNQPYLASAAALPFDRPEGGLS
jgi:hypothetical protein